MARQAHGFAWEHLVARACPSIRPTPYGSIFDGFDRRMNMPVSFKHKQVFEPDALCSLEHTLHTGIPQGRTRKYVTDFGSMERVTQYDRPFQYALRFRYGTDNLLVLGCVDRGVETFAHFAPMVAGFAAVCDQCGVRDTHAFTNAQRRRVSDVYRVWWTTQKTALPEPYRDILVPAVKISRTKGSVQGQRRLQCALRWVPVWRENPTYVFARASDEEVDQTMARLYERYLTRTIPTKV